MPAINNPEVMSLLKIAQNQVDVVERRIEEGLELKRYYQEEQLREIRDKEIFAELREKVKVFLKDIENDLKEWNIILEKCNNCLEELKKIIMPFTGSEIKFKKSSDFG